MEYIRRTTADTPFSYQNLNFLWHHVVTPETKAAIQLTESGLNSSFKIKESQPRCEVKENFGRVCEDSAVELFLAFPPESSAKSDIFIPRPEHQLYLNFELNSAGFIYAKYGSERHNRIPLTPKQLVSLDIKISHNERSWELFLGVPRSLIEQIAGFDALADGCCFAYNLYKICEHPDCEHYAALNPISSNTPNFHRPQDFRAVKIVS